MTSDSTSRLPAEIRHPHLPEVPIMKIETTMNACSARYRTQQRIGSTIVRQAANVVVGVMPNARAGFVAKPAYCAVFVQPSPPKPVDRQAANVKGQQRLNR
jgi:hypothetical protein